MTYEEIMRELKGGTYRPLYLLQGEETYFIDKIADHIEGNAIGESERSFNQTMLYGKDTDAQTLMANAQRYPMMAQRQVVFLKEAQEMKELNGILPYLEKPAPTTVLVVLHKHKKLRKDSKIAKAVAKSGVVFTAERIKEWHIGKWISRYVESKGYKMQSDAVALTAEHLGTSLANITNELDKLMLNLPKGTGITAGQVSDNIGISKEYNVFELHKALTHKKFDHVFAIADYFAQNPKAGPLIAVIASFQRYFGNLYQYHQLHRADDKTAMQAIGLNPYALKEVKAAAQVFPPDKVKKAVSLLYEYDLKAKGVNSQDTEDGELLREMLFRFLT